MPVFFLRVVMLALGHAGITLLLYAPIAYVLLVSGKERAMEWGLLVVVLLTPLPDIDMLLPFVAHRGITHSLVAAVCLGVVVGGAGWLSSLSSLANGVDRAALGFLVGSLSVGSHLLGDVITPMGVRLLFPVGETWYTLNLVSAFNLEANGLLFLIGAVAFWLALHQGRLRAAPRDAAAERSSDQPIADHPTGTEPDRPRPAQAPIRSSAPTRDRPDTDITAADTGD